MPYSVASSWYSGSSDVLTFSVDELLATKIRALYQRSKGRDLFDFWLALTQLGVNGSGVVDAFEPYRPSGYTRKDAIANLRDKLNRQAFRDDLRALVSTWPDDYDVDSAAELVIDGVLRLIAD